MWTFRYGIRAAHTARSRFLKGQARFPKFKARRRDRPRFTVTDGLQLPSTAGSDWARRAGRRPSSGGCWPAAGPGY